MEARKIIIVETKNQRKSTIMSSATTLAELKSDLRKNNIDYRDMAFFEGVSKTELKTDNSILPHDVPYKGTVTNELVFMLTNTNKKIKSGAMGRAEAYNAIKSMGLQDACVKRYGKNFTRCSTSDLITLIQDNNTQSTEVEEGDKVETTVNTPEASAPVTPVNNNGKCINVTVRAAIRKLTEILYDNYVINNDDKSEVLGILGDSHESQPESDIDSPYTDDDIEDMLSELNIC